MYLGFLCTDRYDDDHDELVAWGTNLKLVAADTLTGVDVHLIQSMPEINKTVEQVVEERRLACERGAVTTTDMMPIRPVHLPARPASVTADEHGMIFEVRRNRVRVAYSTLVDDGDHLFHFEWSDFEDATR